MILSVLEHTLAICRLGATKPIPAWALQSDFHTVTRTRRELSIICSESDVPRGVRNVERGYRCLEVTGPLGFDLVGVLASLIQPLAEAKISLFALSTFDTDYLLVKQADLLMAIEALRGAGHEVRESG